MARKIMIGMIVGLAGFLFSTFGLYYIGNYFVPPDISFPTITIEILSIWLMGAFATGLLLLIVLGIIWIYYILLKISE